MQTAFVTGSTGLLGSNLVRQLASGGVTVRALARDAAKAKAQFSDLDRRQVEVVVGDLKAPESYRRHLPGATTLYHTAAYFRDSYKGGKHWPELFRTNVVGTLELLGAAYAAGIRRVVHVSSIAVLGDSRNGLITEDMLQSNLDLVDDYYRSKIETDRGIRAFMDKHPDMHVSFVLPGWIHGPGDMGPTSAGQFVLDYMAGRLPGIVDATVSVVDARDVAQVMIRAAQAGHNGERYLAAGHALSMGELLAAMERVTGVPAPKRAVPKTLLFAVALAQEAWARLTGRPVLLSLATARVISTDYGRRFSCEKISREFGIKFRALESTLRDEIEWFAATRNAAARSRVG
ncbi:NAD-dependent epimerase/dehydratase family protein [Ramlibacter sp. WS9]|nr:NAD-dependent epimerase/dehydratase family protein [Ramlibacter sp. WS9]